MLGTHVATYVNEICKIHQIVTPGPFHYIGPANNYNHTLPNLQCHYQALLTGMLFYSKLYLACKFTTETIVAMEGTTWKAWI